MGAFIQSYEFGNINRNTNFKNLYNILWEKQRENKQISSLKYRAAILTCKDNHYRKDDYIYYTERDISFDHILLILDKEYLQNQYISLFNSYNEYEQFLSEIPEKLIVNGTTIYNLPDINGFYIRVDIDGNEILNTQNKDEIQYKPEITSKIFEGRFVDVYFTRKNLNYKFGISR